MIHQFKIENLKFKIVQPKFLLGIFVLMLALYTLTAYHLSLPIQAASNPKCTLFGSSPRVIGAIISGGAFFGNTYTQTGECIEDRNAAFIQTVPTYDKLLEDYYTNAKTNDYVNKNATSELYDQKTQNDFPLTFKNQLYHFKGNVTVSTTPSNGNNAGKVGIVFIDGNLRFRGNYNYDEPAPTSYQRGTVFVVRGDIIIEKPVTRIDAVLISAGKIYTEVIPDATLCSELNRDSDSQPLIINGNLIALTSSKPIEFCRDLEDDATTPAEQVNLQAKYLVILKNTFSETQNIITEDTNFSADSTFVAQPPGGPPPLGVGCAPSVPSTTTGTSINWAASPTGGTAPYSYLWAGDGFAGETTASVPKSYATGGFKSNITVRITDSSAPPQQTPVTSCSPLYVFYPFFRVFATSNTYQGNLATRGNGTSPNPGVTGANNLCQQAANSANLGGTWKSWISSSGYSATANLNSPNFEFRLVDGNTPAVAGSWIDLTNGSIGRKIEKDEYGFTIPSQAGNKVWTNTTSAGGIKSTTASALCNDWLSVTGNGPNGNAGATDGKWTDDGTNDSCANSYNHLYCFEVDKAPIPDSPADLGSIWFISNPLVNGIGQDKATITSITNICPYEYTHSYKKPGDADFSNPVTTPVVCTPSGGNFQFTKEIKSLTPNTTYYYKVSVKESQLAPEVTSTVGLFTTASD